MKVWTLTESIDYAESNLLGIYTTPELAKEACWQAAEAYPYQRNTLESTEDGNFLSVSIGSVKFHVDEHDLIGS